MKRVVALSLIGVVLFAVLTLVPVFPQGSRTAEVAVSATHYASDGPACAAVDVVASIQGSVRRPVIDLWGAARLTDISVSDTSIETTVLEACQTATIDTLGLSALTTFVVFASPWCEEQSMNVEHSDDDNGSFPLDACDGDAVALVLEHEEGGSFSHSYAYPVYEGGQSRFIEWGQEWCMQTITALDFTFAQSDAQMSNVSESVTDGSACLPLD